MNHATELQTAMEERRSLYSLVSLLFAAPLTQEQIDRLGDAGPVSYTHLDVYKRQVHEHAGQLLADGFRAQRGNHGGVHAAGKAQDHAPPTCARMAAMESMFQFASSPQTPNRKFFSSSLP